MHIRELEERSGMTRANIRFYESEGLLHPSRRENGYRDYTEDDLTSLRRIRLLRALHVSIQDIRALQAGTLSLNSALDQQMEQLAAEQTILERSREVCRSLRDSGVSYASLDAVPYLERLAEADHAAAPQTDIVPRVNAPWRRWFAYMLDLTFYQSLWYLFLLPVFHVNLLQLSPGERLLDRLVQLALLFLLEPLFLSRLGTTPGKWILGLSIRDSDGARLRYRSAQRRTFLRWRYGLGFNLPVYSLIRLWRSSMSCLDGETLEWECDWRYDSVMTLRDTRPRRYLAYILCLVLLLSVTGFSVLLAQQPAHRGEITVAQFCENYNRYADYYLQNDIWRLDSKGHWVEKVPYDPSIQVVVIGPTMEERCPILHFTEENGVMTGVSFAHSQYNAVLPNSHIDVMQILFLSFAGAQKEAGLWMKEADRGRRIISDSVFQGFDVTAYGVRAVCDVNYEGYHFSDAWGLFQITGVKSRVCTVSFSLTKA